MVPSFNEIVEGWRREREGNGSQPENRQEAPDATQTIVAQQPEQSKPSTVGELVDYYDGIKKANAPVGPEEQKRRDNRERARAITAGASDMARALSNLFFTTKGAPDMYNQQNTLSGRAKERRERLKAEDRERELRYYQAMQGKAAAERQKAADAQNAELHKATLDYKRAQKNARDAEVARKDKESEKNQLLTEARTNKENQLGRKYGVDADNAPAYHEARNENLRAGTAQKRASAGASAARAQKIRQDMSDGGSGSGSKVKGGNTVFTRDGKTVATWSKELTNSANLTRVLKKVPEEIKKRYQRKTGVLAEPQPMNINEMLQAIGDAMDIPEVEAAVRAVAGDKTTTKPHKSRFTV